MNETFELILSTVLASIEIKDDGLRTSFQNTLRAGAKAMLAAEEVEAAKDGEDVTKQIAGLVKLAKSFAVAGLPKPNADALKGAVADIVEKPDNPELETALEGTFNSILDSVVAGETLTVAVDAYNPPDLPA